MRIITLKTTNPYLNLATEEFVLKNMTGDFFMLWRNEPAIIVGRNQNTFAEINSDYVRENRLPVVRRLTGGGAVFHDLGNINYTFIEEGGDNNFGNYNVFSKPIIEVLHDLGVPAELKGRNDLVIEGKKFSGNAQTLWHGRMMHHGTLMFSANVSNMTDALKVNPLKIQSKGIKSVRSRVTNISDHLKEKLSVNDFLDRLIDKGVELGGELYEFTDEEKTSIEKLFKEKYSTDAWNYGFEKEYSFSKDTLFSGGIVSVNLDIAESHIKSAQIFGDFFGIKDVGEFEDYLIGSKYEYEAVKNALNKINISDYFSGISAEEFISAMF